MITSPLVSYYLWQSWTDQTLCASADYLKRAGALNRLQTTAPPPVAQTPADVVYTENKLRLLQYQSTIARADESPYPIPLLIVPSIINRYYVLDLKRGRSLVEYLRDRGFDVWMIDWGTPSDEDRFVTFDYHVEGYLLRCVQRILDATRQSELSLLGYCIGGVLTTIFAALHGEWIKNLINLAAPINFHDDGLLSQWAGAENFPVDLLIDVHGNMPPHYCSRASNGSSRRRRRATPGRFGNGSISQNDSTIFLRSISGSRTTSRCPVKRIANSSKIVTNTTS